MNIAIEYKYNEIFLPNSKCRKERSRPVKGSAAIEIHEIEEKQFPIAFKVTEYKSIYKNAYNYDDFNEDKSEGYIPHTEEIRTDGTYLYAPLRVTHGAAISTVFEPVSKLKDTLEWYSRQAESYVDDSIQYTDKSVKVSDDSDEKVARLKSKADEYVISNKWCNLASHRRTVLLYKHLRLRSQSRWHRTFHRHTQGRTHRRLLCS